MIRDRCGCIMRLQCRVVGVLCLALDPVSCMKGHVLSSSRCVILFIYILFSLGCSLELESMALHALALVDGRGYAARRNCHLSFSGR